MKFIKMCKHCGHYFETNSPQKIYCSQQHYRPCPVCGESTKMIDNDFTRPQKCCSKECSHKLRILKMKPKKCILCGDMFQPHTGCQVICSKTHYRNCEICGAEFIIDASTYKTVTTCSQECSRKKLENFYMKKYGAKHPMKSKIGQQHFHNALEEKYGFRHALQIKKFVDKAKATNLERHNVEYFCIADSCREANDVMISAVNRNMRAKLLDAGLTVTYEKHLDNRWFDLNIADQILLEINPTYTHSIVDNHYGPGKDKYYHRDKTQLAIDHGFRCIHVWDWDDEDRIVDYLRPREEHDATEFQVYKLSNEATKEFLTKYHILGSHRGQVLSLGLVKDDTIYQIMTFCKSKYDKNYYAQLCRWCMLPGYEIVGGYDKLSSYASEQFGVDKVIAYVDRSKFDGSELEEIGMKLIRVSPPRKIWSRGKEFINDSLVISGKSKYHSEDELINDGWLPVYDCGQLVYATE